MHYFDGASTYSWLINPYWINYEIKSKKLRVGIML
jgi:hypothetical protein